MMAGRASRVGCWLLLGALAACADAPRPPDAAPTPDPEGFPVATRASAVVEARALQPDAPPLTRVSGAPPGAEPQLEPGSVVDLPVQGFGAAVVAVPAAGAPPHPVAVVAHGNYDRPEWECGFWKRLLPETFLLCPRGVLRSDSPSDDDPRFTYDDDVALEAEVDAALAAFGRRFGTWADTHSLLWIGLSRGAYLGARIAVRSPGRYPSLLLVEGGHDPFTFRAAKRYAEGGGARVQYLCGQRSCTQSSQRIAQRLVHYGVAARVDEVVGMGHGLSYDADPIVLEARPWLLGSR